LNSLLELCLQPKGSCFYVAGDGPWSWVCGFDEAVALFDVPSESGDELYDLGGVA
jgi:hypothetical protein